MNTTTTNGTFACDVFTSLGEILKQADSGALNITQTVHRCQNICALAWGSGNPDLSGIGVCVETQGPIFN
jgi:hypothetical protein